MNGQCTCALELDWLRGVAGGVQRGVGGGCGGRGDLARGASNSGGRVPENAEKKQIINKRDL